MIFTVIASLLYTTVCFYSRHTKAVGLDCFADPRFFQKTEFSKFASEEIATQPVPVTTQGGVGSRCQPARATLRAAIATKHEPGQSPSKIVVSYGSTMHARGEVSAVVPLLRAAWIRWLSAGMSDAAAKLCFFAVLKGTAIRSGIGQFFVRPRKLGLRTGHFRIDR